jgi:type II secretory pathway component PulL
MLLFPGTRRLHDVRAGQPWLLKDRLTFGIQDLHVDIVVAAADRDRTHEHGIAVKREASLITVPSTGP